MPYLGVKPADITSATEAEIAGDLTVDTNTLHVDAANNRVGVGTTSPADHLAVVASGANAHISVDRSDGATGRTVLIHSSSGGQLQTTGSVPLIFGTADTERGRFLSGGGLTFTGDTAAANALDDYEEGTFTPTITTASSYGQQLGAYTKIGNLVNVQVTMYFVQSGTTMGAIQGLPFALADGNYLSIFLKEWYSFGTAHMTFVQSGATATAGIRDVASNSLTASNGSTYGWAFSFTYQTT